MVVKALLYSLDKLKEHLEHSSTQSIDLTKNADAEKTLYDFKEKRNQYMRNNVMNSMLEIKKASADVMKECAGEASKEQIAYDVSVQIRFLEEYYKEPSKALPIIVKIRNILSELSLPEKNVRPPQKDVSFKVSGLHDEIRDEINADVSELSKCFSAGCYRSCVILCGRVLETGLHRKYFEATGHDILEKSPGIGLGNLVGKLKDKEIFFDPGLSQQIHLINQVRIFSVHKKQEAFYPSKDQTQAIILYTLDVVRRLF